MLGQHLIPAGTRIWINVRSLHLDDKYFPNAKVPTLMDHFSGVASGASQHRPKETSTDSSIASLKASVARWMPGE